MITFRWRYDTLSGQIELRSPSNETIGWVAPAHVPDPQYPWAWYISGQGGKAATLEDASKVVVSIKGIKNVTGWEMALSDSKWVEVPVKPVVSPERVRDALLKDPALLWGTLQLLKEIKIAGPWESNADGTTFTRAHPLDGREFACVKQKATYWEATYYNGMTTAPTAEEAKEAADDHLRHAGWLLT